MNLVQRFLAYASAFEETYVDDDWSRLEPFFTEGATYRVTGGPPLGGLWTGRAAVIDHLHDVVEHFDRRFDERRVDIEGAPEVGDEELAFDWRATYTLAGAPDLVVRGRERAVFDGDRIHTLEDHTADGDDERAMAWLARHLPDAVDGAFGGGA